MKRAPLSRALCLMLLIATAGALSAHATAYYDSHGKTLSSPASGVTNCVGVRFNATTNITLAGFTIDASSTYTRGLLYNGSVAANTNNGVLCDVTTSVYNQNASITGSAATFSPTVPIHAGEVWTLLTDGTSVTMRYGGSSDLPVTGNTSYIRYLYGISGMLNDSYIRNIQGLNFDLGVGPTGTPTLTALNCTSCNKPYGSTVSPYLTSDTTPTFTFNTSINANCRVGNQDSNYTTMGASRQCTGGEGLTNHTCTLTAQDSLPLESGTMFIACQNTINGNQTSKSSTGPLQINGIATTPQSAIDYGIHQSVAWPGATVYQNQQVYLRDLNNQQKLATVDRVVSYGNQRWLFNYNNNSVLGLFNISPVVYVLEMANMTLLQVEANVTAYINSTKS